MEAASSYLGDYFKQECSAVNHFVEYPHDHFFIPMATLFVAIAAVSLSMWFRRFRMAFFICLRRYVTWGYDSYIQRKVLFAICTARKLPRSVQRELVEEIKLIHPDMPVGNDWIEFADGYFHASKSQETQKITTKSINDFQSEMTPDVILWVEWFRTLPAEQMLAIAEIITNTAEDLSRNAERDLTRIFFVLQLALAILALLEYLVINELPSGHWFFCRLPYVVSVVSFKPFSIPMWFTLTVVVHQTFVEEMFGNSPSSREVNLACRFAPLPRDTASTVITNIVIFFFFLWIILAVSTFGIIIALFTPVLLIPGFFSPMLIMYVPSLILNIVTQRLRTQLGSKEKPQTDRAFTETVLILKSATTQVISLVGIATPFLPFLVGRYTWSNSFRDIFAAKIDIPTLSFYFYATFSWPIFAIPRLSIYTGCSISLFALQYIFQIVRALLGAVDFFFPVISPPKTTETKIMTLFSKVSWVPFRDASDRVRTSLESAYATRNNFNKCVYNGFIDQNLGIPVSGLPSKLLAFTVGPFLVAFRHPLTKFLVPSARIDDKIIEWSKDQSALAYRKVICRESEFLTRRSLEALTKCVWLKWMILENCGKMAGSLSDFSEMGNLIVLSLNGCVLLTGALKDLAKLTKLRKIYMDNCCGISGSLSDFAYLPQLTDISIKNDDENIQEIWGSTEDLKRLKNLRHIMIKNNTRITGNLGDLAECEHIQEIFIYGCLKISGNTADIVKSSATLKRLNIHGCSKIEGYTKDLGYFLKIVRLNITNCQNIRGSTIHFSLLNHCETLRISGAQEICGNISDFAVMGALRELEIEGCPHIAGTTEDLGKFVNLKILNIVKATGIEGPVEHFSNMIACSVLKLSGVSGIHGNVAHFSNMVFLRTLMIDDCSNIIGNEDDVKYLGESCDLECFSAERCPGLAKCPQTLPRHSSAFIRSLTVIRSSFTLRSTTKRSSKMDSSFASKRFSSNIQMESSVAAADVEFVSSVHAETPERHGVLPLKGALGTDI